MRFHEAALWGAITFVRRFTNNNITGREIMEAFQDYFGLDEETFPSDCAWVMFGRINEKVRLSMKHSEPKDQKLFKTELVIEVKNMKSLLENWLDEHDKRTL